MDGTSEENLAGTIMGLIQKSRVDSEFPKDDDWSGELVEVLQKALDDIETLCREFISAQHD